MKKILLILLALSMFMVSCGGPSKEEAIDKGIEEADANEEAVPETQDDEEPIDEASEENEDKEEKIDEDAEIDYAVSVDGEDYGYVENINGRLFNASGINKIMVRAWKSGEYADDKALDQVTDYSKLVNDNEIIYGVYPGSMEFSYTYNESYNISYSFVGDDEGIDSFAYKKHAPEEVKVIDETLYFDIDYLSSIFAFKYKIDKENKVLVIDSKGEYTAKMTELDPSGYDSLEALLKANFDK
ncbi:MAG: hypothetical protein PUG50_04140 [Eubacteriales bacterium]|uniref:hypothetical protein n=1 Tax=Fenollaria sp. TaxID=1965292 RepID=UPI002A74E94A|nr:hypothetical protein [Fenollaria sp.]MDD7339747.1 hypothetical protein [Eubacteriales bacterium]MDY3106357.1 hypothetical protein [Fenollaria sp.]